jgi:flagellar motor switch/type III secretory pathway protein FliN
MMTKLTPDLAAEVLATSQANAEQAAAALGRCFDGEFTFQPAQPATLDPAALPPDLDAPGLAVLLQFGEVGACLLLSEESGLLPDWYCGTGQEVQDKLDTLARELGGLLLPAGLTADRCEARRVESLAQSLRRTQPGDGAALLSVETSCGESLGEIRMIWPLTAPAALLSRADSTPAGEAVATGSPAEGRRARPLDLSALPGYSRSLLKVRLPLSVHLAEKKERVQEIVEMAPGTIIMFDKSCEDLLQLYVGDQPVAEGEAVKVGDKFGFRVNSIILPKERFKTVRRTAT